MIEFVAAVVVLGDLSAYVFETPVSE